MAIGADLEMALGIDMVKETGRKEVGCAIRTVSTVQGSGKQQVVLCTLGGTWLGKAFAAQIQVDRYRQISKGGVRYLLVPSEVV